MPKKTLNCLTEGAVATMRVRTETVQAFCLAKSLTSRLSPDQMQVNLRAASIAPRRRKPTLPQCSLNRQMRSQTVLEPLQV